MKKGASKIMKKILTVLLMLLLAVSVVGFTVGCQPANNNVGNVAREVSFLTIGGGPEGGMFNSLAAALSEVIGPKLKYVNISTEGTSGGGENLVITNLGEIAFGITDGLSMNQAFHGARSFEGNAKPDIRAVGALAAGTSHWVTLEGSGIKTLQDLKGKRVAVGSAGSSSALIAEELLTALGIWDSIQKVYLLGGSAVDALIDGQVDALTFTTPHPAGLFTSLVSTHNAVFLDSLTLAQESGFMDNHPYLWAGVIEAGTYNNDADVPVINVALALVANVNVDEEAVYDFTKAAYQSGTELGEVLAVMGYMTPQTAVAGITIPLHPGAQRALKELGVDIPVAITAK